MVCSLIGLTLGFELTWIGLDTTIAADVQGPVYESLGEIQNLPWVGLGFPMASVATILLIGRSYGLFQIKTLMLMSIFIFEIGSALCGASPNMTALILGRVIAGIGGAGMYLGYVLPPRCL
jgi:MFS family permease